MKTLKGSLFTWCAAAAALSGTAYAQSPDMPQDPVPTPTVPDPTVPDPTVPDHVPPVVEEEPIQNTTNTTVVVPPYTEPVVQRESYWDRIGIEVAAGGGVAGFTGDALRSTTTDGGSWTVRASVGTRSPIAFEGSYIGSAQAIDALGLDDDAVLLGNGVQGALRLNMLMDEPVQPFLFGGLAWTRFQLTNSNTNTSDILDEDDVLEIPLGLGIAGKWSGLVLDLRGEFRVASEEDLVPAFLSSPDADADSAEDMHRWGVNATVGYEF
ncbi:MAG: hypothetical protein AB7O24_01525 [Kofleriaceae bacterium]